MTEGPVNAIPEGLLDILGVKAMGRYPDLLSDRLITTLNVFDLLNIQRRVALTEGSLSLTGVGATLCTTVVPAGEIWYVVAYQWVVTLGAGMTSKIRVWCAPNASVAPNSMDDSDIDAGASGTTGDRIRAVKRNFWANSGAGFGATAITNTGGPITSCSANWLYVPFKR